MRKRNSPGEGLRQPSVAPFRDTGTELYLVSCVKTKGPKPTPAKDLYASPWFRKARAYAEKTAHPWHILSAQYGLVHPERVIRPYEKTLKTMPVAKRRAWAETVLADLEPSLTGVGTVVFLAGQVYREFLAPALRDRGLTVHVPMAGLSQGRQLSWLGACLETDRFADTTRFYELLADLEARLGGARVLADCSGGMNWPDRGVYFFLEPDEAGGDRRVVRVGTHALTAKSRSTLWRRLAQHRGTARTGGGNHRGSIFRLLVGIALASRDHMALPPSWGKKNDPAAAGLQFGMSRTDVKQAEAELEARVSRYIGTMPFLWLNVGDAPGSESERGVIERNAIALLSDHREPPANWLGRHSDRDPVRRSGLWNNQHVGENWDPSFLDLMEKWIEKTEPA